MSETKHTPAYSLPLPYAVEREDSSHVIVNGRGVELAWVVTGRADTDLATAEFIVRACNSYDALLATCENVVLNLKDKDFGPYNDWYRKITMATLEAAIAEAKA